MKHPDVFAAIYALEFHRQAVAWMEANDERRNWVIRNGPDDLPAPTRTLPREVAAACAAKGRQLAELAVEALSTPTDCMCFSQGWASHNPKCPNSGL